jgi:hypothetical protein
MSLGAKDLAKNPNKAEQGSNINSHASASAGSKHLALRTEYH